MQQSSQDAHEASTGAPTDDDSEPSIKTILARLRTRSQAERQALVQGLQNGEMEGPLAHHGASGDGNEVMSLPSLKSADTDDIEQSQALLEGSDSSPSLGPLPGTSFSQSIENARGSSEKRSPESVCYDELLRENGSSSGGKSRKIDPVEDRICYGKLSIKAASRCGCERV
jgi:hypothetical protein